ncbi:MAG: hypothetical protein WD825_10795 [Gemmatimonadaceae bacterium]
MLSPLFGPAGAQVIRVKTIPVAESEQFSFLPSAGTGSVAIAVADTLADPFSNPAKMSRVQRAHFFGAPTFFSVTGASSGGSTFPLGVMWHSGPVFGGFGAAFQQINRADSRFFGGPEPLSSTSPGGPNDPPGTRNRYSFGTLGYKLDSARLSIAGSASWSGLEVVEGVDQFYTGSEWIRQQGEAVDLRIGVLKEWRGKQSLEAVLVRNRFGHSHNAGLREFFWDPATRNIVSQTRVEHNAERTNTWGLHLEYERPLADSGWRIGALFTGNRIEHPRLPNYEILTGFGHDGRSSAYNFGVGVGRSHGLVTYGIDAIYEPISSRTRMSDSVENRFRFSNAKLRAGLSRTFEMAMPGTSIRLQLGAELYSVQYVLNQHDRLQNLGRVRKETWLERTQTGGMSFGFPGFEIQYQLRSKSGLGRQGLNNNPIFFGGFGPDVLGLTTAPIWGPENRSGMLESVRVTWHQITVSIPHR